ncbi:MAG: tryptophan--tRNA ligase, partial [Rhodoferax sp.]|nr:tryptophan--tRNA ligase [Rhodoferax sp.]
LRHAVGLRGLASSATSSSKKASKPAGPQFKQYREKDGLFYFKLLDAKGQVLLQSLGLATPQLAGQCIARLQKTGLTPELLLLMHVDKQLEPIANIPAIDEALRAMR